MCSVWGPISIKHRPSLVYYILPLPGWCRRVPVGILPVYLLGISGRLYGFEPPHERWVPLLSIPPIIVICVRLQKPDPQHRSLHNSRCVARTLALDHRHSTHIGLSSLPFSSCVTKSISCAGIRCATPIPQPPHFGLLSPVPLHLKLNVDSTL